MRYTDGEHYWYEEPGYRFEVVALDKTEVGSLRKWRLRIVGGGPTTSPPLYARPVECAGRRGEEFTFVEGFREYSRLVPVEGVV